MPRVLHLLSGLEIGGKERIALDLARRGQAAGDDAHLLLFDDPYRAGLDLDPGDVPWGFLRRGPGFDRSFVRALRRHLTDAGIEVVHAHNDTAIVYAALAARGLTRRAGVVGTFHTYPGHDSRGARLASRVASVLAGRVTSVSDELGARLARRGWIGAHDTVWNGVDRDAFRPREPSDPLGAWRGRLGIEPETVVIAHIARADPIKRHADLFEAFRALGFSLDRARLVCVATGDAARLEAETADDPGIALLPRVDDVAAFLRDADVLALPSDDECAPLVLLEAMASGLPVVASAVGGCPTILDGGAAGRLVPPRDPAALARCLDELVRDADLRRRLGAAARARSAAFDADAQWDAYAALYARHAVRAGS